MNIPPVDPTPESLKIQEVMLRADAFKAAYSLIDAYEWADGFDPADVIALAHFLMSPLDVE